MLRLARSPYITKKSYRICVCGDIETELHILFYCKFHNAEPEILCNKVCNVVTDKKLPGHFEFVSNVELLRILLFGLPDDEPSHISMAAFCALDNFRKSCYRF